ncbi:hypothetical protein F511_19076 [Dorcoceras hygrometricum]|uniref:Uncharacterized protein n=1 Tax=Dorcoceras hygrometricum TaxID=472368 RepID=A0A2Z7AJ82_9LAMI|nr:hypothetical protein F511_19076 [Dorcoceras hygrometricum]
MDYFTVNALQVNFEYVLSMDIAGMVKMFKSLEESGLRGFLGVSGSVFEGDLIEFFANATVIAGTIVSTMTKRKMVVTKDVFAEMFQLLTEGMVSFSELPAKAVVEMKVLFSATGVPFRPPNKKKDMKVEYRMLHDIVAKSLSAKAISLDLVTTKKLEMMVAISVGLKEMIKQHRAQRNLAGLPLLVPVSLVAGYFTNDILQLTWAEGRIVSNQGTSGPDQDEEEQATKAAEQRILAIEHKAQRNQLRTKRLR